MSDETPAPAKPKGKPGVKRFKTKAERGEAVRAVARLVKRFLEPADIVRWAMDAYGVTERTGFALLKDARSYVAARWAGSKELLRGEVASFLTLVLTDAEASWSEKISAASQISKLCGLFAPDKVVSASLNPGDLPPDEQATALRSMRQALIDDPEAMDLAHSLYEKLGRAGPKPASAKTDPPKASLEERIRQHYERSRQHQTEHQALMAELDAAEAAKRAAGPAPAAPERLPVGLKELPPGNGSGH